MAVLPRAGPPIRPSRTSRWRAFSLLLVHALMILHVLHWVTAGRTVSPVEPSEAMETLRDGHINAGFLFLLAALLATLILGRFVCGWGCHLVAYQDLTAWVLKKLKWRSKPFRARLLLFVPLLAALYMFVWPVVGRWALGLASPHYQWQVTKTGFWDTFPGPVIAVLTIVVCGMAIIHLLGAKAFCTYACPYGALFGLMDKFAPGRIRVTDACEGCGHCTAVCTSNVRVAEEVRLYKMVVDPGCLKCMDCVSVCPNGALYFGFGPIAWRKRPLSPRRPVRYDMTWPEEIASVLVFAAFFFSSRGLYGEVPFLFSLGIAAVGTYLVFKAVRLLRSSDVSLQKARLKIGGRIRPAGYAYLGVMGLVTLLLGHSAWWQCHALLGSTTLARPPIGFGWHYDPSVVVRPLHPHGPELEWARGHLEKCERWGLFETYDHIRALGWLSLHAGDLDAAAGYARRAALTRERNEAAWVNLARIHTVAGDVAAARSAFVRAIQLEQHRRSKEERKLGRQPQPASAEIWADYALFLWRQGEQEEAERALETARSLDESSDLPWVALADCRMMAGRTDDARRALVRAIVLRPASGEATLRLTRCAALEQDFAAALEEYRAALVERPGVFVLRRSAACALAHLARYREAVDVYQQLLALSPGALDVRAELGAVLLSAGDLWGAIGEYEFILATSPRAAEAAFRLGFLYEEAGRQADALRAYGVAARWGNGAVAGNATEALRRLGTLPPPP